MLINTFEYDHDKYGTISVQLDEEYNEIEDVNEVRVWAIYYKGEKESHMTFNYLEKEDLPETKVIEKLNKLIK